MPKRRKTEEMENSTPRKTRRTTGNEGDESSTTNTPSARKSILRGTPSKANGAVDVGETPKGLRKVLFSTTADKIESPSTTAKETPPSFRNDLSAHRRSRRALQQQRQRPADDGSSEDEFEGDAAVAEEVLRIEERGENSVDEEEEEEEEDDEIIVPRAPAVTDTPTKRRGRPPKKRDRTPSPPPDLPPHELYFFQNRAAANKTSSNTLPSHLLLNHEDYFAKIKDYKDPQEEDVQRLQQLHARAFDQWLFELDEGFSICLYGYGSKRDLAMEFAEHMHTHGKKAPKIVVVNGYTPGLTIRDILITLAGTLLPKSTKLPAQPQALLDSLLAASPPTPVRLIIHSLDHPSLRKSQPLLARLASHHGISLLATVDTPSFALLWDTALLRQFRWLYHDTTTFQPYRAELDVVEEANGLLGRNRRRLGGKDGVAFVLKSLPENARNLFRILVAEQLALAAEDPPPSTAAANGGYGSDGDDHLLGASDDEEAAAQQNTPSRRRGRKPKAKKPLPAPAPAPEGVEYRALYHKAVAEFVCSSELSFRTLLKEFHDHAMVESRRDGLGGERLVVPFGREELEGVLGETA